MVGNLTHIMRILLAFAAAYFAKNCPYLKEWEQDFLWIFSLTMLSLAILGIIVSTCEYYGLF